MEAAREKLSRVLKFNFNEPVTNGKILDMVDLIKKHQECSISDLALSLNRPLNLLTRRLYSLKTSLKPLSKEKRQDCLKTIFNTTLPTATATSSSTSTVSQSFSEIVQDAQQATTSALVQETQARLEQEQGKCAALKEKTKEKTKEQKLLKRKTARLAQRLDAERESAAGATHQLEAALAEESEVKKSLETQNNQLRKQLESVLEEQTFLKKEKEVLIERLKSQDDRIHKSQTENVQKLKDQIKTLTQDLQYVESLLNDEATIKTTEEDDRTFNTKTVECVMKLLDKGVAQHHVSGVMADVASLCGRTLNALPSSSTVNRIADRQASLVRQQLAEALPEKQSTTLQTDETRKRGDSFEVYAVRDDEDREYVLGLRDILDKGAQTCLSTFKTILGDIEETTATDVGKKILSNIQNTMSDRAASEKKFHSLLEDYRKEVLPTVHENWDELSENEQESLSHMNNFYCGLHILVNFAEVSEKVLKRFEDADDDQPQVEENKRPNEGKTVRLVRQASKCFARGGDEKSGCYQDFRSYMMERDEAEEGLAKTKVAKLLAPFRGNRFNILFFNAEVVFFIHKEIRDFFSRVQLPSNGLQKAVSESIQNDVIIATLKALGLCSKLVTSPFWRALEEKGSIEDANSIYAKLHDFLREAKGDASDVLTGTLSPFPELVQHDESLQALTTPDDQLDGTTCTVLQLIFNDWLALLNRAAGDHLPGGRYWQMDQDLAAQTTSVPRHNKLPERVFGLMDALMRARPAASTLCNETYIQFSLNKTASWMASLTEQQLKEYMDISRKEGRAIREQYQRRIKEIEQARRATIRRKREERASKEQKALTERLSVVNNMLYYGLWQRPSEVDKRLATIHTAGEKKKALKTQLSFRKLILGQAGDKKLFQFSDQGKEHTWEKLAENVKTLVAMSLSALPPEQPSPFVGRNIIHYQIQDGERTPFPGTVISSVPGYPLWHNVVYAGDSAVYVYKLQEDMDAGDLEFQDGSNLHQFSHNPKSLICMSDSTNTLSAEDLLIVQIIDLHV
ncbi:uncharacterized protein [Littorina saxatilis]|uniref:uncharacterized protein n=1 Tax=Littorina saxatilis TaxID=31220 RepID=UPI0038B61618